MDLVLKQGSDPIYRQIYEQISFQILDGRLLSDECLPSIRMLAAELRISVITVKKAFETLEEKGFIYTQAGKGSFVKSQNSPTGKKVELAKERLAVDVKYYQDLGISADELKSLIDQAYNKSER